MRAGLTVGALLALLLAPNLAQAHRFDDQLEVFGYGQFWLTAYEQMERVSQVRQNPSLENGTDRTTGFSLSRARVGARLWVPQYKLGLFVQTRLDRDGGLLDLVARFSPWRWLSLELGQMKVPSTGENLTDDRELDFVLRSTLSANMGDYALARSPFTESLLSGVNAQNRDMGIALKGEIPIVVLDLRYFFMVGNGLGANLYIGGDTRREFVISNRFQFFTGGRIELADRLGIVTLGAHGSQNLHDNMVMNSGRAVYDLHRVAWSTDLQVREPRTGLRLGGLVGAGKVREDYDGDGTEDLDYSGWSVWLVWNIMPLIARLGGDGTSLVRALELGARADQWSQRVDATGSRVRQHEFTFGMNLRLVEHLKVQANYILRRSDDPTLPDYDNDILLVNVQLEF